MGRCHAGFDVTVVVPTLNERDNVDELVRRLGAVLADVRWELIIVDDDSPDGTAAAVKALARRDARVRCIRRIGRRGLAGACLEGILASAAPVVAVMDADLQHDESILPPMVGLVQSGTADVAVGSRSSSIDGLTPVRRAGSSAASRLSRLFVGGRLADPMSGFFAIRRELVELVAPRLATSGFKILADILACLPQPVRVLEVPYAFRPRYAGASKFCGDATLDYAGLIVHRLTGGLVPVRFVSFALVGASGVLVHLGALRALLATDAARFAVAQSLAALTAATSNYVLNNLLTYRDVRLSGSAFLRGLLRFYAVCSVGFVTNVGVATWVFEGRAAWWAAGLAGALVAAVWNYAVSSTVVWRDVR